MIIEDANNATKERDDMTQTSFDNQKIAQAQMRLPDGLNSTPYPRQYGQDPGTDTIGNSAVKTQKNRDSKDSNDYSPF